MATVSPVAMTMVYFDWCEREAAVGQPFLLNRLALCNTFTLCHWTQLWVAVWLHAVHSYWLGFRELTRIRAALSWLASVFAFATTIHCPAVVTSRRAHKTSRFLYYTIINWYCGEKSILKVKPFSHSIDLGPLLHKWPIISYSFLHIGLLDRKANSAENYCTFCYCCVWVSLDWHLRLLLQHLAKKIK